MFSDKLSVTLGGAASHEGSWWDNSAGAVSYAADPYVDDERDFLGNSAVDNRIGGALRVCPRPWESPEDASSAERRFSQRRARLCDEANSLVTVSEWGSNWRICLANPRASAEDGKRQSNRHVPLLSATRVSR
jgi:hypothetical protein